MKDYKELLLKFAQGEEDGKEREYIKNLALKFIKQSGREELFKSRWGDDFIEDFLSELRWKLHSMKESLQGKDFISWSYFLKIIRSSTEEFFQKLREYWEIPYEHLKPKTEGDPIEFEETLAFSEKVEMEESLECVEFYKVMLEIVEEKDYPVLCYYICKDYQMECEKPLGLSEANLYKRWERLKKKLKERLPYEPSPSAVKYFMDRFMSEICQRQGYLNIKEGKD